MHLRLTCIVLSRFVCSIYSTACGENNWGAFCSVSCANNGNCNGKSFCVPDPVGCSCMAGFTGKECNEGTLDV